MRRPHQQIALFLATVLGASMTGRFVRAEGAAGASTLRAVSIAGVPAPSSDARYAEAAPPQVSQARFAHPTVAATSTPEASRNGSASRVQFAKPARPAESAAAVETSQHSSTSSLSFVSSGKQPTQIASSERGGWVQQAQYVAPLRRANEPVAAPYLADTSPTTLTMERASAELSTQPVLPTAAPTLVRVPAEFPQLAQSASPLPPNENMRPASPEPAASVVLPAQSTISPVQSTMRMQPQMEIAQPPVDIQPAANQPVADLRSAERRPAATPAATNHEIFNHLHRVNDAMTTNTTRTSLSQMPQRSPLRPATSSSPHPAAKPHQGFQPGQTVSPYLNLYRNEDDGESAPNYYAFVRPQMEQQEATRGQQVEIQRLQRQLQSRTVATPQYGRRAVQSNSATAARYMDTAQFYSGWKR